MPDSMFDARFGDRQNHALQALHEKRAQERLCETIWTMEPCVVEDYDFATQRVSVRLKNFPGPNDELPPLITGVPILGTGGQVRIIRAFRTRKTDGDDKADVGVLLFPRSDCTLAWERHNIERAHSHVCHSGVGPVFIPGPLLGLGLGGDAQPSVVDSSGNSNLDKVGPADHAILFLKSNGNLAGYACQKNTGELVIKGDQKVYVGDLASAATTFKKVVRDGDTVSGGAVTASSTKVYAG